MTRIAALIVQDSSPIRFCGRDLTARAIAAARRGGATEIAIAADDRPFLSAPEADRLLVVPERAIAEPALLAELAGAADSDLVAIDRNGARSNLLVLSRESVQRVRTAPRLCSAVRRLGAMGVLRNFPVRGRFCAPIRDARDVARVEAEYLTHTNGGDQEGWFTRNIRRCSVPLTRRLLRFSISANVVTLAGFALAIASGAAFAVGSYWSGMLGAALYWASMVLDCCDGEVARATLSDSKFGAWLETVTDYLSYFAVLGGIVYGDVRFDGFCVHARAAAIAAAASLAIVGIVGYLRARVAADNPGAFDDTLAADLGRGTGLQRFAVWGRQLIKRSFVAHLIAFQALIGQMPALTEIWAYGSIAALLIVAAVQSHIVRNVRTAPLAAAMSLEV